MRGRSVFAAIIAGLVAAGTAAAQNNSTPGVENPLPNVWVVHPDKVPSPGIDKVALEAAITAKKSFSDVREMLGGDGVPSAGPAGTTVHIYKAHDTATGENLAIILFVKDDVIVEHLVVPQNQPAASQSPQQ